MNIFYVDPDPVNCAKALDDKRVVKMVLETAQLLSGALRIHGYEEDDVYKLTHKHHPCLLWCSKGKMNFNWLVKLGICLCNEYTLRFNKTHKSEAVIKTAFKQGWIIPRGRFSQPPSVTKEFSGSRDNVCEEYRLYLDSKWQDDKRPPKWTNSEKPSWSNFKGDGDVGY